VLEYPALAGPGVFWNFDKHVAAFRHLLITLRPER
jgi:hypothetical protein